MNSGDFLFKRQAEVLIVDKRSTTAQKITDLRVSFEIEKYISGNIANKAVIKIYNVSEDTFSQWKSVKYPLIKLNVGYSYNQGMTEIFSGDITNIYYTKDGTETTVNIECGDGLESLQKSKLDKTYNKNFKIDDIISDMLNQMKLTGSIVVGNITKTGANAKTKAGFTVTGQVKLELEKILAKYNQRFTIQDNTLHILPLDGSNSVVNTEAVRLSPLTGLLSIPIAKKEKDSNYNLIDTYEFKTLILAEKIAPAYAIIVETEKLYLPLKLIKVSYSGDTHGQDWVCNCTGVEL